MSDRLRSTIIPAYLLLCLLLGGSTQGVWRIMILQLLAVALIAVAAAVPKREPLTGPGKSLLMIVAVTLGLFVVQLIPLPPGVWTSLPGRGVVAEGFASLGYDLPWLPLSLAPYDTLAAALALLPPLAVLLGVMTLKSCDPRLLASAVLTATLVAVLLGALQTLGGSAGRGWSYLYDYTNSGAVGLFANSNFMGTLLLVSIPFAAALVASSRPGAQSRGGAQGLLAVGLGGFLLILVGLALNRSTAAILLALPVIAFSALLFPLDWRRRRLLVGAAVGLALVAAILFTSSPLQSELSGADTASFDTRLHIWQLSWSAIADSFPFGTGFGTFDQVFALYEDEAAVDATFINHAHSELVELAFEGGLPALLLIAAFLLWWAAQARRVWTSPLSSHFARAATVASGAILAHSLVDYPLRTPAIAAVFAASLALMIAPSRQRQEIRAGELRPTRHVTIG